MWGYSEVTPQQDLIKFFISCSIRKVTEVLAEVDDIFLTDSYIRYISKRVHKALSLLRVINILATNILLTVDRHMYFAVDVLGLHV